MLLAPLAQLIMINQSLFSLPWGVAALLLAWPLAGHEPLYALMRGGLALVAMLLARTAGMSLNRWIDRSIDSENPRTASRPLQVGAISLQQVIALILACFALLILIAASLGTLFLLLLPPVVGLLILYSYTKRFTWACHFVLGSIYACAPVLAYLALCGRLDAQAICLGLSAGLAISGADILYALQDMQHDRQVGLYSIPARFGPQWAQKISLTLYAMSSISLAFVGMGLSPGFWIGWLLFAVFPLVFHGYIRQGCIYQGFFRCSVAMPFIALMAIILGCPWSSL